MNEAPFHHSASDPLLSSVWQKRRRALHALNLVAPAASAGLLWAGHPGAAVATLGSAHAAWLASTLWPNAPWSGRVVGRDGFLPKTSVGTDRRLWLTIDDGPCRSDHEECLRLLDRAGVKVSAFVIGHRAATDPELVKEWHAAGHSIENHTWNHAAARTWIIGPGNARDEVNRCQDYLGQLLGRAPVWFRAPAGLANPWLHAAIERRGLSTLAWTVRGFDAGLGRDPAAVVRRIRAHWKPGGIVLMHQGTTDTKGKPLAPQILERLLDAAAEDGYSWATPRDQL